MTRRSRGDWIEEGFRILVGEGDSGLTVDALCDRLERTKGSFYHHFNGRGAYVQALLAEWESRATDRFVEIGRAGGAVSDRLRQLNREASELGNAGLERAIRLWAAGEPLARRAQDRVDGRRLALLGDLCVERMGVGDEEHDRAFRMARVLQLVFVGAQHLDPPLEGAGLYAVFRFLDPLFDVEQTP